MKMLVIYAQAKLKSKTKTKEFWIRSTPDCAQVEQFCHRKAKQVAVELATKILSRWRLRHRSAKFLGTHSTEYGKGFSRVVLRFNDGREDYLDSAMVMDSAIV